MPPKKAASVSKSTINPISEAYKAIGELLRYNVELLPKGELVDDTLFSKIAHKKTGMTVGKIVSLKTDETADFLLKKSGRYYSEDDRNTKDLSRDMSPEDLLKGIKESFNEKCAAELFNILKGQNDYLPEFRLVRSIFNTDKPHNKLKRNTEAFKVYIASKIIGDRSKVNAQTNSIDHLRLLDPEAAKYRNEVLSPEEPEITERRERLKDDLLENAVIMILLSNYDIKLDNFVHDNETMIPIDFGNAKVEEELSPDVIDGIDLIRRSRGKAISDQYASKSMKERFSRDDGYIGTQSFYNRNLQPKHFLGVIEKIKSNHGIEEALYQTAHQYTFGTQKEKEQYAEVLVARVRNLVALEPVFTSQLLSNKPFGQQNLRNLVANNSEFQLDLREENSIAETNPSEGKIFFKTTCELFTSLKQEQEAILAKLQTPIPDKLSSFNSFKAYDFFAEEFLVVV